MEFMAINMASSLTAHASHDPRQLAEGVRGALRRMTLLLVPGGAGAGGVRAADPRAVRPGLRRARHRPCCACSPLGALPRVVVELYIGVLRVQGRTGVLAVLQGAMCALVLGSAAVLFTPAGIAGAGWAVLISMTLIAVVSVFGLRSALRDTTGGPVDRSAAAPDYGTRWARLERHRRVRHRAGPAGPRTTAGAPRGPARTRSRCSSAVRATNVRPCGRTHRR